MLNTYENLVAWIEKNVPKKDRGNQPTIAKVAIWFVCVQIADEIHEYCSARDLASLVQDGIKPTNTTEAVEGWLKEQYEEDLVEKLKSHFGI